MARLTFWQIFRLVDSNTLEVTRKIKVGGVGLDVGAKINRGVTLADIDFFKYINSDIEGDQEGDAWVVKRIYPA